jgi:tetratricopeptide (TPR) repeat protein
VTATLVAVLAIGLPALAFTLWPLVGRRGTAPGLLPRAPDRRQQLEEEKHRALAALRELAFEHESGHISDADYAELRARYESEAARVLTELDRLVAPAPARPPVREGAAVSRSAWRHPVALGAAAIVLVAFGVVLGTGIARHSESEPPSGAPAPGSRPLAALAPAPADRSDAPAVGGAGRGAPRPVTPEMLQGMLSAAHTSLFAGRYGEAIAAYQAILKRDPKNVDAMTHLGLIVAIGGHADTALETFDKVLALEPNYPPVLLYRGQVLYEVKKDTAGAIKSWEKFLAIAPPGEDRERVAKLIQDARAKR